MRNYFSLLAILIFVATASAQVRLPRLISNGMILQRNVPVTLWGWAAPNEAIRITMEPESWNIQADDQGYWSLQMPAHTAGGPHTIELTASNQIRLKDIYFGEVWLCSGQSNMELMMDRVKDTYPQIIASANNPYIRQFTVPDEYDFKNERNDYSSGSWVPVTPESIFSFSAVAYFFASDLYQKYQVPIGLINAALGGSPVQSWMSEEALRSFPEDYEEGLKYRDDQLITRTESMNRNNSNNWFKELNRSDAGLREHWYDPKINDASWSSMRLPDYWIHADSTVHTGTVWFRKHFDIPEALTEQGARLFLGRIVDADSVYLNGQFIGSTGYQYPPRKYAIPAGLLRQEDNVISVRVISQSGNGGFVPDKPYAIYFSQDTIDLKGEWKYRVGTQIDPIKPTIFIRWKPMGLFNAMIAPMLHYTIKGAIWFQGESNTGDPSRYQALLTTMIRDWRTRFNQENLPFIIIQLANFMEHYDYPTESNWAQLREAQRTTAMLPNTGLAVTIDLGEWNDIHPLNKKDVGQRTALQAFRVAYGEDLVASGPSALYAIRKGKKIQIEFSDTGTGMIAKNGSPLLGFTLCGMDNHWYRAIAKIKGKKVVVKCPEVQKPDKVRYAWANNPEGANLYNREGLPASPFELNAN